MIKPYYQASGITIYHADCFELLHDFEAGSIGGLLTDPPYSSGGFYRGDRAQRTVAKYVQSTAKTADYMPEFAGDNRDQRSFLAWSTLWLCAVKAAAVNGAPVVCFTDWRQLPVMSDALQAGGWVWRNVGTWWKPGVRMQRGRLSSSAEYVVYGTNGEALDHDGCAQNVVTCPPVPTLGKEHVAQKPEAVIQHFLQVFPRGMGPILDPFIGRGTTLIVAKQDGREAIGIDVDERYCEMAARNVDGVLRLDRSDIGAPVQGGLVGVGND